MACLEMGETGISEGFLGRWYGFKYCKILCYAKYTTLHKSLNCPSKFVLLPYFKIYYRYNILIYLCSSLMGNLSPKWGKIAQKSAKIGV